MDAKQVRALPTCSAQSVDLDDGPLPNSSLHRLNPGMHRRSHLPQSNIVKRGDTLCEGIRHSRSLARDFTEQREISI